MVLYVLGLAAIGLVSGLFIGLSQTPVIGIALPIVLGLVAGGTAFKVPTKGKTKTELWEIGACLLAIGLSTGISALYGSLIRTGASLGTLVARGDGYERAIDVTAMDPQTAMQMIRLDRRLAVYDLSAEDRTKILANLDAAVNCPEREAFRAATADFMKVFWGDSQNTESIKAMNTGTNGPTIMAFLNTLAASPEAIAVMSCMDPELLPKMEDMQGKTVGFRQFPEWNAWMDGHPDAAAKVEALVKAENGLIGAYLRHQWLAEMVGTAGVEKPAPEPAADAEGKKEAATQKVSLANGVGTFAGADPVKPTTKFESNPFGPQK